MLTGRVPNFLHTKSIKGARGSAGGGEGRLKPNDRENYSGQRQPGMKDDSALIIIPEKMAAMTWSLCST